VLVYNIVAGLPRALKIISYDRAEISFLVVRAGWHHPFPSRTRK
jgi:hypothetical protein